jgi:dipeptide/tripeptide permease
MTDGELPLRSRRHSSDQRYMKDGIIMRNAKTSEATEDTSSFLTPVVWCILVCEAAERFAYFGFRAVLVLYFTNALHFSESTAIALFAYVASLAYFSPLIGALLADGSWGRYQTITCFGCMYFVGLSVLTAGALLFSQQQEGSATSLTDDQLYWKRLVTFAGLFLVCIGTGGIKPCVSAFGADQVAAQTTAEINHEGHAHPDDSDHGMNDLPDGQNPSSSSSREIQAFFAYFYFCINLGAVASIFLVPILKAHLGFGIAFLAPTIFLFLALTAFWSKRKEYVHHIPGESGSLGDMLWLCGILLGQRLHDWWRPIRGGYHSLVQAPAARSIEESHKWTTQQIGDAAKTLEILPILSMLPIFWMLYDQQGSVWTLQATRMKLSFGIEPEHMNVVNPVEIMTFIPLLDTCIYPQIERVLGRPFTHLSRMAWGMCFCALSFFGSGFLETYIQEQEEQEHPRSVSIFWQIPQITILSIAEILLSVTCYDFCYSNSSARCKALILALYLVTVGIGDFLAGILYNGMFQDWNRATVMHTCGGLMLINLVVFRRVARWWNQCQEGKENPIAAHTSLETPIRAVSFVEKDNGRELAPV